MPKLRFKLKFTFRGMIVPALLALLVVLGGLPARPEQASAQGPGTPRRLGEFQVEWYCNQRGYGVAVINNFADWACTNQRSGEVVLILQQQDFDAICRATYNEPRAYALRDQNKPQQAYNWSCYVNIVPPTPTPYPPGRRLGEFQVEWYCNQRGYGVIVLNNTDWACTNPQTNQVVFVLGQQDFDNICRATYRNQRAFARRDQNRPEPAYDWSCYTPLPTPTPYPPGRRLGEFQVEWYCNQRGYGVVVLNNTDWACTNPQTNQVVFVLGQQDFDNICRATYRNRRAFALRDQNRPEPAYNWSCYAPGRPSPTPIIRPTRLGEAPIGWYCSQRGYGAALISAFADWACTFPGGNAVAVILNQTDYTAACQSFYRAPKAYAIREQNPNTRAYAWACYLGGAVPPTLTPFPTPTSPPRPVRLGEFRVEWYCNEKGYGVAVVNNNADWACTNQATNQVVFILGQQDFDQICRRFYNNPAAYALRDQNRPEPAYNWSCYVNR